MPDPVNIEPGDFPEAEAKIRDVLRRHPNYRYIPRGSEQTSGPYPRSPRELIEWRRIWLEWAVSPFGQDWLGATPFVVNDPSVEGFINAVGPVDFRDALISAVAHASLFLVDTDMQPLIDMAAEDVPPVQNLGIEDMPVGDQPGFILWGDNHPGVDYVATLWMTITGGEQPMLLFADFNDLYSLTEEREKRMFPRVSCVSFDFLPLGTWMGVERLGVFYQDTHKRQLLTAMLLMQQKVARTEIAHASRAEQRAGKRLAIPPRDVTVVYLPKYEDPDDIERLSGGGSPANYSHRFMVRGFWRDQWYPSRQVHRPKYIFPFIKGPVDKPLVLKERVGKVVKRPSQGDNQ